MQITIRKLGGGIDDERILLYSTPSMKRGAYTVTVSYEAEDDAYRLSCTTPADGKAYPILYADKYRLQSTGDHFSFRLWLNDDIDYLLVRIEADHPVGEINIERIYIQREFKESLLYLTFRLGLWLVAIDLLALAFFMRKSLYRLIRDNFGVVFGLTVVFCVCVGNVITPFPNFGHDAGFHLARITGIAESLLTGNFPVRLQPGWCSDYGYPVSVFYGDLLLYLPALLYLCWIPLVYAYKIYLLLIHAGTIAISFFCFGRLCRDRRIAVVCTALYCLAPIRIMDIYIRAALGEYTAYMFLPLVLLGAVEMLDDTREKAGSYAWLFLCIGMTGILQSHMLSFEMTCIMLGIALLISFKRFIRRRIFADYLRCIVVTIVLNLGFLVPFLDYAGQKLEIFSEKSEYGIQGYGLSLYELFALNSVVNGSANLSTSGLDNRISVSLGLGMTAVLALLVAALFRLDWNRAEKRSMAVLIGLSGIGVAMSTYYFPWNRLAAVPGVRNVVSSIQFPWRFLNVSMPVLVYMAGLLLIKLKSSVTERKLLCLLVGISLLTVLQGKYHIDDSLRDGNAVIYDGYANLCSDSVIMGGEYLFKTSDRGQAMAERDIVGQNASVDKIWRKGNSARFSVKTGEGAASVELPLFAYAHYRCSDVVTGEEFAITAGDNNKIRIDLPSDWQGELSVRFVEPWYWRASEFISLLTFAGIMVYALAQHRRKRDAGSIQRGIYPARE